MIPSPRQTLRRLVLATNRWPLLSRLYRIPYHLAVRAVVALARRSPLVLSLHVKGSFAAHRWTPGLSDIDFTILVRDDGTPDEEFALLVDFRLAYARLVQRYPMLGELEIMTASQAQSSASHSFASYEMRTWRCLYGPALSIGREPWDAPRLHAERLRDALRFYRHHFPRQLRAPHGETAQRLHRKLCRTLESPEPMLTAQLPTMERVARCLLLIDCYPVSPDAASPRLACPSAVPGDGLLDIREPGTREPDRRALPPELRAFAGQLLGVAGAEWDAANPFVIVRDLIPAQDLAALIAAAAAAFDAPIVVTPAVFRAYLHLAEPMLYFALRQHRILWGEGDPLAAVDAPTHEVIWLSIRRSANDIYRFPYQDTLGALSPEAFRGLALGWLFRTLRFAEEGVVDLQYHTLEAYFADRGFALSPLPETWRGRFLLCRQLAREIERRLAAQSI